jgi:transcriptional regulator GlxA family with amidase domain
LIISCRRFGIFNNSKIAMKHISILVLNGAVAASIIDPHTLLNGVNDFLESAGQPRAFDVQLVGLTKEVKLQGGVFSVHPNELLPDVLKTDLIIIPALSGELKEAVNSNQGFVSWIINQNNNGAEVASLCIGSFLLASTGLLNGKECSSHWLTAHLFREMFPEVNLVDGRVVTEQNGLYSSGGATSYWNLLLHLVEKYVGREMAIMASKVYALEIDRTSQSPFTMFKGQKRHGDEPIKQAQEFIENNLAEKMTIDELAEKFAIGKRHFERRFKQATTNTPQEYIQRVRVEAAKKHLEISHKNVNEVMYDVGYADIKAFRSVFKKITGLSPMDYRSKYNREAAAA